jgi:membrane protein
MKPATLFTLLRKTSDAWFEAKAPTMGAALAYYTIFSVAPLLVMALVIGGMVFGPQAAHGELAGKIEDAVEPAVALAIQDMLEHANQPGSGPLAIIAGSVVLLFGASGVFVELHDSLNTIWQVQPKPGRVFLGLVRDRFLSFTMVLGACFILLASLVMTAALAALAKFWTPVFLPGGMYLWQALNALVGLAIITLLFAMIYKYLPDARIAWRDVRVGAAVTALLFTLGKYLLGLYLSWSSTMSAYGAAGSLVLILIWVYYSAQVFLFGAAFTRVYAEHSGRGIRPADNAVET